MSVEVRYDTIEKYLGLTPDCPVPGGMLEATNVYVVDQGRSLQSKPMLRYTEPPENAPDLEQDPPEPDPPPEGYFNIIASADFGGTVTPSGTTEVLAGGSLSVEFTPKTGKAFLQWLIDETQVSTQNPFVFNNVQFDRKIYGVSKDVVVETIDFTIAKISGNGTTNKGFTTFKHQKNAELWVLFYPDSGWEVTEVLLNGVDVTTGNETGYYFATNVLSANTTLSVKFEEAD